MWGGRIRPPAALDCIGRHADGFVLQLADPQILEWTRSAVMDAATRQGRAPGSVRDRRGRAGLCRRRHRASARAASLVRRHGGQPRGPTSSSVTEKTPRACPRVLSDYIRDRAGLRLLPPRPRRQPLDRLRSGRHRGSLLRAGAGRGPHRQAHRVAGHGHRPLRHLPHARCGGRDPSTRTDNRCCRCSPGTATAARDTAFVGGDGGDLAAIGGRDPSHRPHRPRLPRWIGG